VGDVLLDGCQNPGDYLPVAITSLSTGAGAGHMDLVRISETKNKKALL
jgi:hypothetical protein